MGPPALGDLGQAVDEAGELAVGVLAHVGREARTRKVQRVHDQQRPRARKATCAAICISKLLSQGCRFRVACKDQGMRA